HARVGAADRLDAELMELALPSSLRPLVSKHGTDVIQLRYVRLAVQFVFHIGPNDTRGAFGSQGHAAMAFIVERIHFLFYDVGRLPDPSLEQLGLLENRRADFLV